MTNPIPEHDRAVLLVDQPDHGLRAGEVGVVIHVHPNNSGYLVEFPAGRMVPVDISQVRAP